jgi:hypothetical protein
MVWGLNDQESNSISSLLGVQIKTQQRASSTLGFTLKASGYKKVDWAWLLAKIEKRILSWCNRWLSRAEDWCSSNQL